jgi:hypothetical protein
MRPQGYGRTCRQGHKVTGDNVRLGRVPTTGKPYAECRRCYKQQTRVPVSPEDGVKCLICDDIMRVLAGHMRTHGITLAEYRERFPDAPVTGAVFKGIQKDRHTDRVSDGTMNVPRPKGICLKGHVLTRWNTDRNAHGRQCRECRKGQQREYYRANRERILERRAKR